MFPRAMASLAWSILWRSIASLCLTSCRSEGPQTTEGQTQGNQVGSLKIDETYAFLRESNIPLVRGDASLWDSIRSGDVGSLDGIKNPERRLVGGGRSGRFMTIELEHSVARLISASDSLSLSPSDARQRDRRTGAGPWEGRRRESCWQGLRSPLRRMSTSGSTGNILGY